MIEKVITNLQGKYDDLKINFFPVPLNFDFDWTLIPESGG